MLEILPETLFKGIQIIGLTGPHGEHVAQKALLAFKPGSGPEKTLLNGLWIEYEPVGNLLGSVLRNLNRSTDKKNLYHQIQKKSFAANENCPVCKKRPEVSLIEAYGRYLCPEHLSVYWLQMLQRHLGIEEGDVSGICGKCSEPSPVLLKIDGSLQCLKCLSEAVLGDQTITQWVFKAGPPTPMEGSNELHIFQDACDRVQYCLRCGSKAIRIHRIILDFPKAGTPIYPVWETSRRDYTPEEEDRRLRQIRIYSKGLMSVTIECPQCGYLTREFPGVDLSPPPRPTTAWRDPPLGEA